MEQQQATVRKRRDRSRHAWVSLMIAALTMVILLTANYDYFHSKYGQHDIDRFERILRGKEASALREFDRLKNRFNGSDPLEILDRQSERYARLASDEGVSFFYFESGRLLFWSDHTVPVRPRWSPVLESPLIILPNGTYVALNEPTGEGVLLALILVKNKYPYENEYLQNSFQEDFSIAPEIEILTEGLGTGYEVHGRNGEVLFELDLGDVMKQRKSDILVAIFSALLMVISLFLFFYWRIATRPGAGKRAAWLVAGILSFSVLLALFSLFEYPPVLFEAKLFQPEIFANQYFPSLGVLLTCVLFFFFLSVFILVFFDRSQKINESYYPFIILFFVAVGTICLFLVERLFAMLVLDSNISFEAFRLGTLSVYTFLGLTVLALAMLVFCFFILKALRYQGSLSRSRYYFFIGLGALIGLIPFFIAASEPPDIVTLIYLFLFIGMILYMRSLARRKLQMSSFFLPLLLFSVYASVELQYYASQKTVNEKQIELAKLSSQHDAVAEMLFVELSEKIRNDSLLQQSLIFPYIDIDYVYEYLHREYFSGYWTKYDMQITVCRPVDSVYVKQPVDEYFHCYSFFDEMLKNEGVQIPGTDFYFLDNLDGRISYLASFRFRPEEELSLFLELDSRIISEELGYPELLLSREARNENKYPYAIYNQGKLITSSGNVNYRTSSNHYTDKNNTFETFRSGGFEHSILNIDENNMVIVSSKVVTVIDRLISFSYIFAFYFLLFAFTWTFLSAPSLRKSVEWNFKNKIQYSMIGILFMTFVFICAGTIYFIVQQYRDKHHSNLENTMRSLYIELIHKVEFEEDLRNWTSDSYYNLDELLRKFSNVFYTDINMYDERGVLLATSRNEIFNQRLLSVRMNRVAFEKLAKEHYSAYIHTEQIGRLNFQSAYVPLLNSENHLLAYLNLPYFTQPGVLTQEVSNLIVAILNIYVLLLLIILFLSVFLADRITQPLRVIQNRIAQLSLGKQNEKIVYRGRDEIRGLVEEYNFMVDELHRSAELLAISERETAWREMAKQIAHEIKNPLTPMKLNLQHLDRLVTQDKKNLEVQVRKVIQTLVEQIDSLTSIANEFSDFAKMPRARSRDVNLAEKIRKTVQLFQNNQSEEVLLDMTAGDELHVIGDPEQIQRVIINLVKNGIQSVPESRKPEIWISLERTIDNFALISVQDNGKGIPEDLRDKLFQPNFTTKSSGMGMGLAISASIVRSMNGEIWYESKLNEGTVFHVKFPLAVE